MGLRHRDRKRTNNGRGQATPAGSTSNVPRPDHSSSSTFADRGATRNTAVLEGVSRRRRSRSTQAARSDEEEPARAGTPSSSARNWRSSLFASLHSAVVSGRLASCASMKALHSATVWIAPGSRPPQSQHRRLRSLGARQIWLPTRIMCQNMIRIEVNCPAVQRVASSGTKRT